MTQWRRHFPVFPSCQRPSNRPAQQFTSSCWPLIACSNSKNAFRTETKLASIVHGCRISCFPAFLREHKNENPPARALHAFNPHPWAPPPPPKKGRCGETGGTTYWLVVVCSGGGPVAAEKAPQKRYKGQGTCQGSLYGKGSPWWWAGRGSYHGHRQNPKHRRHRRPPQRR